MARDSRPGVWGHVLKAVLLVWCSATIEVVGYSRGAPDTACSDMTPQHGISRATGASPFKITPSSGTVEAGKQILVTLEAPDDSPGFKGFLVQAKKSDVNETVGTFFTTDHSYLTCGKGFNNAVTHSSPTHKPKVILQWQAPSDFEGDVVFKSSFVESFDTFWVGVTSEKVTVTKAAAGQQNATTTTIPSPPITAATPAATPSATPAATPTATEPSSPVSPSIDAVSPNNVGDLVINVVDAPGVDDISVVENDIGVAIDEDVGSAPTPTLVSSPSSPTSPSLSSTTSSSSSSLSEDSTSSFGSDSSFVEESEDPTTTQRSVRTTTQQRRFGLFGKFKTTTQAPTTAKVMTSTTIAPASKPSAPRIPSEDLPPGIADLQNAMESIYFGCQSNKGCFGFPSGCVDKENCEMLMTYASVSSGYQFEIMGNTDIRGYVAAGLSSDTSMGSDSVMACTSIDGEVDVHMAYNDNRNNEILSDSKYGLKEIQTTQVNGKVYCSFVRQTVTEIKNEKFDLAEDRFHLMLAKGTATENKLQYHNNRLVSSSTSSMEQFRTLIPISEMFVTLHACFMIGAWVCTASCGILLARYYKQTWLQNRCCGIDQWFHLHRFFMTLTWSLTVAGFVLIVYYKQGWTTLPPSVNPHPILGVISIGLCFIQPFMALCRCSPNHKNRPVFNWFHWFVGNSAQILGLTAIFYGLDLIAAPSWTWFILIIFIAFHCVMHLILSIGQCVSDSKADSSNNVFPMKEMNGSRNPLHPVDKRMDAPGGTFRKTMLAIYLIVAVLITGVLIVIVIAGESQLREWGILFWEK